MFYFTKLCDTFLLVSSSVQLILSACSRRSNFEVKKRRFRRRSRTVPTQHTEVESSASNHWLKREGGRERRERKKERENEIPVLLIPVFGEIVRSPVALE